MIRIIDERGALVGTIDDAGMVGQAMFALGERDPPENGYHLGDVPVRLMRRLSDEDQVTMRVVSGQAYGLMEPPVRYLFNPDPRWWQHRWRADWGPRPSIPVPEPPTSPNLGRRGNRMITLDD